MSTTVRSVAYWGDRNGRPRGCIPDEALAPAKMVGVDEARVQLRGASGTRLPPLDSTEALRYLLDAIRLQCGADREADFRSDLFAQQSSLYGFARSLTRDPDSAMDLTQETLTRAWAARDRFEAGTNISAWLRTIMRRFFIRQSQRARLFGAYDEQVAEQVLKVGENQSSIIDLKDVLNAMDRLPAQQREALQLVVFDGLAYRDAADRAGTSIGTIKSRLSRARSALQDGRR